MTAKERNLLKGAIRRVFARSDLRLEALAGLAVSGTYDPSRPRVTKWSICPECNRKTPRYLFVVDHIDPVIPVHTSLEQMSWDEVVNRTWCALANLNPICKECHIKKTKKERKIRDMYRRKT